MTVSIVNQQRRTLNTEFDANLSITGNEHQDSVLKLIDTYGESFFTGIAASDLEARWPTLHGSIESLFAAVGGLLSLDMVAAAGDDNNPRFTITEHGYQRLRSHYEFARTQSQPKTQRPKKEVRLKDAAKISKFIATESVLRNAVMDIYRDFKIPVHGEVIAASLSRIWDEKNLPPADLRLALNLLLADGYLDCVFQKNARYFRLTPVGHAFCESSAEEEDVDVVSENSDSKFYEVQREIVLAIFKFMDAQVGQPVPFLHIQREWVKASMRLDDLLKIMDDFMTCGILQSQPEDATEVRLTEDGIKQAKRAGGLTANKQVRKALKKIRNIVPKNFDGNPSEI